MGSTQTSRFRRAPRRGPAALILAGALALTGCAGDDDDSSAAGNADTAEPAADVTAELPDDAATADEAVGGFVASDNQSAQDVTEQLVNLDVRIRNARQSVANVREFMDRTENLQELVTLESELTRRQTELEQLEAQQRNLADRVALSTITIEVVPTASVPEPPADEADDGIGDAFRSGWEAFTALLFGIGFVLAATLPFLISGLLLAFAAWIVVRRRDARQPHVAVSAPDTTARPDIEADQHDNDNEEAPVG